MNNYTIPRSNPSTRITEQYRNSDEYKVLAKCVLEAAPNLPPLLVDQAIFMHKSDPLLYRKWDKLEREWKAENPGVDVESKENNVPDEQKTFECVTISPPSSSRFDDHVDA